jgi:alpha-methylacyl-CoA racemase
MLDTGAHYYNTYACRDGRYLAVGAIEPQFYAILRDKAGWSDPEFDRQNDRSRWPSLKEKAAAIFRTRDRDEWVKILAGSDACAAPVLTLEEAERDPHLVAREAFVELDGVRQAAPAPRFSRTPSQARPSRAHDSVDEILSDWNAAAPGA